MFIRTTTCIHRSAVLSSFYFMALAPPFCSIVRFMIVSSAVDRIYFMHTQYRPYYYWDTTTSKVVLHPIQPLSSLCISIMMSYSIVLLTMRRQLCPPRIAQNCTFLPIVIQVVVVKVVASPPCFHHSLHILHSYRHALCRCIDAN